jgi:hypothetical protein
MRTVSFFNKQQNSVNLQNQAALQIDNNLKSFIDSFTRIGFLSNYSEADYGFTIQQPTFSMGTDADHLNISIANGNIFGINANGDPLILSQNESYQILDSTQDGGNLNIPLSATSKPYTNYIYLIYRQTQDKSQPEIDFDGTTNYPIKNHGYYIYVSTSNTYVNAASLYCGSVTVNADSTQTYNYSNVLIAGLRDTAVKIQIPSSSRTFTTSYNNGDNKTLRDHISSIGSLGIVSPQNPHGIAAKDVQAVDGVALTSSNQFKNGFIVAPTSNTLQLPLGAQVYSALNYIMLSLGNDGIGSAFSGFIFQGNSHYLYELINTFVDGGTTKAFVSFTNSDSIGWYLIYIAPSSLPNTFQMSKIAMSPGVTRQNGDSNIWLGFIYWNGTALCLNERNIATTGSYILPAISYAWIDKGSINKEPSNYDMINQNLISNDPALYDITMNGKYTKTIGISSLSHITQSGLNWLSIFLSGTNNWETFTLYTNQKLSLGSNAASYYTLSFKYNGGSFTSARITFGGQTYYLPNVSGYYSFIVYGVVDSINFQFQSNLADTVYLNNIQLYQGVNPTSNYIEAQTYTNEVMFDSNQSKYNNGTLQTIETRIDKINLDNILQLLPIVNTIIKTSGNLGTYFTNWSNNISNLELWFVRMVIPRTDINGTSGYYSTSLTFGTNYAPVYIGLNRVSPIYSTGYSGDNRNSFQELYISSLTNSNVTFYTPINSIDSGAYSQFANAIAINGIMIMQKIS